MKTKLIIPIAFIFSILFYSFGIKSSQVSKYNGYKAYYNTSYGRFSFDEILVKRKIKHDEFLSNVFQNNGLRSEYLGKLMALPDSLFNTRNVRVGNSYSIAYKVKNNSLLPHKFIYEKNKVEYIVANLNRNFDIELGQKEVEVVERTVAGDINSSLYVTMDENNINPLLAVSLAEMYAWTIDFYKIQKGDYFKVVYSEEFVDGKSLNEFKIKGAIFSHKGKEYEAYFYQGADEDKGHFYDQNGDQMKQAFLKSPVKYSRISSAYSPRRFHPVQKRWKAHLGTDYAAPTGTPILATADGVVIASEFKKYNGNYVKIKHNGQYMTQYLHMSKRVVKNGQRVSQGDVIGYVGSTGLATGPHVCYRFWKDGKQVSPNDPALPKSSPMQAKYLKDYLKSIISVQNKLKNKNIEKHAV